MGLYVNSPQGLQMISGRGKAVYGASDIRKKTITTSIPGNSYVSINVTFDDPLDSADYLVEVTGSSIVPADLSYLIYDKTVNGFKVYWSNYWKSGENVTVTYTAYKLYTDLEYNGLLKLSRPDLWPVDTEIDLGNGLYGKRYTGIWNGAGNAEVLDASIKSPACKLVDYMAWQHRTSDNLQLIGSSYYDGGTRLFVQLYSTGVLVYHNLTDPTTYDIWIKYTKTT